MFGLGGPAFISERVGGMKFANASELVNILNNLPQLEIDHNLIQNTIRDLINAQ